jgi:hypothetical protein
MFPLSRKTMRKPNPRRPKMRIHHRTFTEISPRLRYFAHTQIIHSDGKPRGRLFRLCVREGMRQKEEFILLFELVETAEVGGQGGDGKGIGVEDLGC